MGVVLMHWTYLEMVTKELEIVRHAHEIESELWTLIDRKPQVPERGSLVDLLTYHYQPLKKNAVLKVIILSAMMLEAYVNNIAKQKLPGFEREALDKLDIAAKWVLIPRLAFGSGPEAGSDLICRIAALQKERNFLVHAKPLIIDCDDTSKMRPLNIERAENAAKTCFAALSEIQKADPYFEIHYFQSFMPDLQKIRNLASSALAFENQLERQRPSPESE